MTDYRFLAEKEEMWAGMLTRVLEDQKIPYTEEPVRGAGFAIHTGIQDRIRIYVPEDAYDRALALLGELFPAE